MCLFKTDAKLLPDGIYYKVFKQSDNRILGGWFKVISWLDELFFNGLKYNKRYKSWLRPGFHAFVNKQDAERLSCEPCETVKRVKMEQCLSIGTFCDSDCATFKYMTILDD